MQAQQFSIRRRRTHQFQLWIDRVAEQAHQVRQQSYLVVHDVPQTKFGQFFFLARHFGMDLPNSTLEWSSAERIVRERTGFFWFSEHAEHCRHHSVDCLVSFDPLGKHYDYGNSSAAAEDLAYVLFDVWRFCPRQPFRVLGWSLDNSFSWREFIL